MQRRTLLVTPKKRSDALPAWATEYVVLASDLERRGVLNEIAERLRVARRGAYCGLDVVLFLLSYFSSGLNIGLRPSAGCVRRTRGNWRPSATGGRRRVAVVARIGLGVALLSSVNEEQVESVGVWLLGAGVGAGALGGHGSIVCRDSRGESWHAFDYDPPSRRCRIGPCLWAPTCPSPSVGRPRWPPRATRGANAVTSSSVA
jgi:hypothetical protein